MRRAVIVLAIGLTVAAFSLLSIRLLAGGSDGSDPGDVQLQVGVEGPGRTADGSRAARLQDGLAESQPGGGDVAPSLPQVSDRKIIRNASLDLEVEDVLKAVQRVEGIAAGAGGFVASSSVFVDGPPRPLPLEEGEGQVREAKPQRRTQTAFVTIRVPASEYRAVMDQLRGIAEEVRGESSTTSDVSEEFADLQARLRNLEATEAVYLSLLAEARTTQDILIIQDRINAVRLEIEQTQGRLNLLNDLTDLAAIEVQLRPFLLAGGGDSSQDNWAAAAAADAWEASQAMLRALGTGAIFGGIVLAWLAVPALAIAVVWRFLGLRRPGGGQA